MSRTRTHPANKPASTSTSDQGSAPSSAGGSTDYGPDFKTARWATVINDEKIERLDALEAEEVTAHNCKNLTEINAPKARMVIARGNPKLKRVNAPSVTSTIDVRDSGSGAGVEVIAEKARKVLK